MFLRRVIVVMLLFFTTIVNTSVHGKCSKLNLGSSEAALVSSQTVSVNEKKRVLKAIASLYGVRAPITIDDLAFTPEYPTSSARRGVVLLETKGKLYLLNNPCDLDWSEMEVLVYSRPYGIKRAIEKRYCENRKFTFKLAEVKQK